ncbi:MAG TPA: hypothetical protein VN924_18995 [Bryobacteraceae bacterium]|nr:hypothetical protein [Bryobacteraceae bacterium]
MYIRNIYNRKGSRLVIQSLSSLLLILPASSILPTSALCQTPVVGGLLNNYSFTSPGLPNYGIAQGSIFDIFGTNLSTTTTPLQNQPLQSTLNGVTVNVGVSGTTTHPLIYFLSPTQIAAVLPSATPVGTGTVTVSNSAGTSAAFSIEVVESAFGLLTLNNGSGPAGGFDASNNNASLSVSAAANPGDILELWGTGLGPVVGDATLAPVSAPIEVDIGGTPATILYHGRSGYVGLDQINVQVPAGVSGCNVSVAVVTGKYVSNFATLPVTASGRTCTDPNSPVPPAAILDDIAKTGTYSLGIITVIGSATPGSVPTDAAASNASATFARAPASQLDSGSIGGTASIGSCSVTVSGRGTQTFDDTILNAGPNIYVDGPLGAVAMPYQQMDSDPGFYLTPYGGPAFVGVSGTVTFNNGSGGPDVGPFATSVQMPLVSTWTNFSQISTISRAGGLTLTWSGGDPNTYIGISGSSIVTVNGSSPQTLGATFGCVAPVSAGTFTVPASILMSLPPSGTASLAFLGLSNSVNSVSFSAPGIDYSFVLLSVFQELNVVYQ